MKTKIHKNYFDVVILPPKEIQDYAIKLSKQLYKYGTKWVLGKKSFLPHISLYHIPVKLKDFDNFIAELESIVKGSKTERLKVKNIRLWEPYSSVLLMTNKPEWLKKLYLKVIKNTLKYFDWDYGIEKLWHAKKMPKTRRKILKRYGTPIFGHYFIPHITLGVFKDDKNMVKTFNKLRSKKYGFKVKSIFVCQLGEDHSCQRIIKQIYF